MSASCCSAAPTPRILGIGRSASSAEGEDAADEGCVPPSISSPARVEVPGAKSISRKLLDDSLCSVPPLSSKEFRMFFKDFSHRQEEFLKQVLNQQRLFQNEVVAMLASAKDTAESQFSSLLAEIRSASANSKGPAVTQTAVQEMEAPISVPRERLLDERSSGIWQPLSSLKPLSSTDSSNFNHSSIKNMSSVGSPEKPRPKSISSILGRTAWPSLSTRLTTRLTTRRSGTCSASAEELNAAMLRLANLSGVNASTHRDENWYLLLLWERMLRNACDTHRKLDSSGPDDMVVQSLGPRGFEKTDKQGARSVTIHPASFKRLFWDIVSMCLVIYDLVVIPLVFFDVPETIFDTFCTVFWTLDIPLSFITGFQVEARIEMGLRKTAHHYVTTWFLFDTLVLLPDWIEICLFGGVQKGGLQRLGKTAKIVRICRCLRLVRVMRLKQAWTTVRDRLANPFFLASMDFGKLILLVLGLNHYSACFWYGLGKIQDEHGWVNEFFLDSATFRYKYLTSLHWSISQFHGGMEAHPSNSLERAYALSAAFVGLVASSGFISSITNLILRAQKIHREKYFNIATLSRYLQENGVSFALTMKIKSFVRRATYVTNTGITEVALLKIFPANLHKQLDIEIKTPVIHVSIVLNQITKVEPNMKEKLCLHVLKHEATRPSGLLFESEERSEKMFLLQKGKLIYNLNKSSGEESGIPMGSSNTLNMMTSRTVNALQHILSSTMSSHQELLAEQDECIVHAGSCISEMNLWTASWRHRGDCTMLGSVVYSVKASRLVGVLTSQVDYSTQLTLLLARHAANYIEWMRVASARDDFNDLTECPRCETDIHSS